MLRGLKMVSEFVVPMPTLVLRMRRAFWHAILRVLGLCVWNYMWRTPGCWNFDLSCGLLHQGNFISGSTMTSLGGWAIAHARVDDVPQKGGSGVGMEDGHDMHIGHQGLTDADALDGAKHTASECTKSVPCSARLGYCQWALCCMRGSVPFRFTFESYLNIIYNIYIYSKTIYGNIRQLCCDHIIISYSPWTSQHKTLAKPRWQWRVMP